VGVKEKIARRRSLVTEAKDDGARNLAGHPVSEANVGGADVLGMARAHGMEEAVT
jgi:hypothetical protein